MVAVWIILGAAAVLWLGWSASWEPFIREPNACHQVPEWCLRPPPFSVVVTDRQLRTGHAQDGARLVVVAPVPARFAYWMAPKGIKSIIARIDWYARKYIERGMLWTAYGMVWWERLVEPKWET